MQENKNKNESSTQKKSVTKKKPTPHKKTSQLKKELENKWMYGIGYVDGIGLRSMRHQRIDLYFLNLKYPAWSYKVGYAYQYEFLANAIGDVVARDDSLTSKSILLGIGYNVYSSGNFFVDTGAFYRHVIDQSQTNSKYATYSDGSYWWAENIKVNSTVGLEIGLGYSFGSITVRSDLTLVYPSTTFYDEYRNADGTLHSHTSENGILSLPSAYITVGITYWF